MDTKSRDASLHDNACDRCTTVSIVADGSHHGGNAFGVSIQHALDDEDRPSVVSADYRNAQGNQTPGNVSHQEARARPVIRQIWDHLSWHLQGGLDTPPAIPGFIDIFWSWGGAFCGILLLSGLTQWLEPAFNLPLLYASFGASAVLVFGIISSPLAQPRNFVGGQVLSAVVGCCMRLALGKVLWLSAPLGMSLALVAMMLTRTTHPPGGATAIIASVAHPLPPWDGFKFVISILLGSLGMLLVALVFNNAHPKKRYPTFWY